MTRLRIIAWGLAAGMLAAAPAEAADRVASVAESPFSSEPGVAPGHLALVDLIHALDRVTHSSTRIVLRPFARSLKDTAAGLADFHLPFIQDDDSQPPPGLLYVKEVDFGHSQFIIYSRKLAPYDAKTVATAKNVEAEPDHESFFPFPVKATYCVTCSLEKVLLGRTDAMIVAADVVDPLLSDPKYKEIHRALYKIYPIRALVPADRDSAATRRYLVEGVRELKESGELWKIMRHDIRYSDWQP
ncbi:MAG TPA: hypothetical protein VMC10_12145 [Stellaceae bacterium]|nr:hypothetical protein [Stellaceae bacterium]